MFNIDGELMSLGLLVWLRRSFLELYQGKLNSLAEVIDSVLILTSPGPRRLQPAPSGLAAQTPGCQNYQVGVARRQQDDTYKARDFGVHIGSRYDCRTKGFSENSTSYI